MVDSVNALSGDALTSEQRDNQLAANSVATINFIEDIDTSIITNIGDFKSSSKLRFGLL